LSFNKRAVEGSVKDRGLLAGRFLVDLEFLFHITNEESHHCVGISDHVELVWVSSGRVKTLTRMMAYSMLREKLGCRRVSLVLDGVDLCGGFFLRRRDEPWCT